MSSSPRDEVAQRRRQPRLVKAVSARLPEGTLARVDALVLTLCTPWRKAKRADALRKIIATGIVVEEQRLAALRTGPPARTRSVCSKP